MTEASRTVVLVVEDEPLILMNAMQSLEDAGFEVLDAYDVEHALIRLGERPDINAVFTDVNLPGRFDGVQLARTVSERQPNIVVIVTSGAMKIKRSDLPENSQFIPKPYRGEHIAGIIKELTGAAG